MRRSILIFTAAIVVSGVASVFAQGQQYGTLGGRVVSADHLPLPGVTVTVSSDALQGTRSATTDVNGVYTLQASRPAATSSASRSTRCRASSDAQW